MAQSPELDQKGDTLAPPTFDFGTFPVLTTDRLRLRQITSDDAADFSAIFGSPDVLRFLNLEPVTTTERALDVMSWLAQGFQAQREIDWAITRHDDDRMIGMCGLHEWDQGNQRVEIGWHLHPSVWRQGYATEAARAIIAWGFQNLDVHRIWADCTVGNDASERIMIKCGFQFEGHFREHYWEHGRFVDARFYGLLRRDFEALSAK